MSYAGVCYSLSAIRGVDLLVILYVLRVVMLTYHVASGYGYSISGFSIQASLSFESGFWGMENGWSLSRWTLGST